MNRLVIRPTTEARDSMTLNRCFSIMDDCCLALTNGSMTLLISLFPHYLRLNQSRSTCSFWLFAYSRHITMRRFLGVINFPPPPLRRRVNASSHCFWPLWFRLILLMLPPARSQTCPGPWGYNSVTVSSNAFHQSS